MDLFPSTVYFIFYLPLASVLMEEICARAPKQTWKGVNKDEAHSPAKALCKMSPHFLVESRARIS